MSDQKKGKLYIVATPIGNLQDITLRAIEVLKEADRIVAEDTRHAQRLLKHFSIIKPTLSLHEFNERERTGQVLACLEQGETLAYISDAGTPLISDPGFYLVKEAKSKSLDVIPIPGPCAAIVALSVAALPSAKFVFEGFLPPKDESRRHHLATLSHESQTMIFYEAPHRLLASLNAMSNQFGENRKACVARELTKIHETLLTSTLDELCEHFSSHPNQLKGEVVIIVHGIDEKETSKKEVIPDDVLELLLKEMPVKQAVALTSKITGERKNILYAKAIAKKSD